MNLLMIEYILNQCNAIDLIDYSLVSKDWYLLVAERLRKLNDKRFKIYYNQRKKYPIWDKKGCMIKKLFVTEWMLIFKLYEDYSPKGEQTFDFVVEDIYSKCNFLLHRKSFNKFHEYLERDNIIEFFAFDSQIMIKIQFLQRSMFYGHRDDIEESFQLNDSIITKNYYNPKYKTIPSIHSLLSQNWKYRYHSIHWFLFLPDSALLIIKRLDNLPETIKKFKYFLITNNRTRRTRKELMESDEKLYPSFNVEQNLFEFYKIVWDKNTNLHKCELFHSSFSQFVPMIQNNQ